MNADAIMSALRTLCPSNTPPAHHYTLQAVHGGDHGECIYCGFARFWPTVEYDSDINEDSGYVYNLRIEALV